MKNFFACHKISLHLKAIGLVFLLSVPVQASELEYIGIEFSSELAITFQAGDLSIDPAKFSAANISIQQAQTALSALKDAINNDGLSVKKSFELVSEEDLENWANQQDNNNIFIPEIDHLYEIEKTNDTFEPSTSLLNLLNSSPLLKGVEEVEPIPEFITPSSPGGQIQSSQNLENLQTYLNASPGINAKNAWSNFSGSGGDEVKVLSIDSGWEKSHVDFPTSIFFDTDNYQYHYNADKKHGNLAIGIVASPRNNIGISGIAHNASVGLRYNLVNTRDIPNDLLTLITNGTLNKGDIVLFEHQAGNAPIESRRKYHKAIKSLTSVGITVIESAGNNSVDLDASPYNSSWINDDSGAIIVGSSYINERKPFLYNGWNNGTNYGSRVDVHAWGSGVLSMSSDTNDSYLYFDGTSAAAAMVAGVAASIQGMAKHHGFVLTPHEIRNIIKTTGVPQTHDLSKNIGPLPNLFAAGTKVQQIAEARKNNKGYLAPIQYLLLMGD